MIARRPGLAVAALLFLASAALADPTPPWDPDQPRDTLGLLVALSEADACFFGKVVSVGEPPGVWCGVVATFQEVVYEPEEPVIFADAWPDGGPGKKNLAVKHYIVANSRCVDRDAPRLRPELFEPGARFLVSVRRQPEALAFHENFSVLPVTAANAAKLEAIAREAAGLRARVLALAAADPQAAQDAVTALCDAGRRAAPFLVRALDGEGDLLVKHISLVNKAPDAFEGMRHYGPKKVAEAAIAILNDITGESHGPWVCNGEEKPGDRAAAIAAWKEWWKGQNLVDFLGEKIKK